MSSISATRLSISDYIYLTSWFRFLSAYMAIFPAILSYSWKLSISSCNVAFYWTSSFFSSKSWFLSYSRLRTCCSRASIRIDLSLFWTSGPWPTNIAPKDFSQALMAELMSAEGKALGRLDGLMKEASNSLNRFLLVLFCMSILSCSPLQSCWSFSFSCRSFLTSSLRFYMRELAFFWLCSASSTFFL